MDEHDYEREFIDGILRDPYLWIALAGTVASALLLWWY